MTRTARLHAISDRLDALSLRLSWELGRLYTESAYLRREMKG